MENFIFQSPTRIYFGQEYHQEIGKIIAEYGFKKILFHYGKSSIKTTGLYQIVVQSLNDAEIEFIELSGVEPNPKIELVQTGIELIKNEKCDFILAVGGGSVIDSAKLIAHGVYYPGDPFDLNTKRAISKKALPLGVILTIAASGSELSTSCVISKGIEKRGFNSEFSRPLFVIENPTLLKTLPKYQLSCGIVDIIAHTLERYFNRSEDIEFSDYLGEGLLKATIKAGHQAYFNPNDKNALGTLMIASSFSHNGLTSLGKNAFMPCHQIEHEISGFYHHIAHGAGLAVVIPAWMKAIYLQDIKKFKMFAENVMMIKSEKSDSEIALLGIKSLSDFFKEINMPSTLKELGVNKEDLSKMADHFTKNGTFVFNSNVPLDRDLFIKILESCYEEK